MSLLRELAGQLRRLAGSRSEPPSPRTLSLVPARSTLLALAVALALAGVAYGSNYGGWESGGAIMCNSSHNGALTGQSTGTYRCQYSYHYSPLAPNGLWDPYWGFIGLCPGGNPYYGSCWHWEWIHQ